MTPGVLLGLAIAAEVAASVAARYSLGLTQLVPSLVMVVGYGLSFWLLSRVLLDMQLSVAYAIWAAAGTAAIAAIGILILGETVTPVKLISLGFIVVGVIGVNLSGGSH